MLSDHAVPLTTAFFPHVVPVTFILDVHPPLEDPDVEAMLDMEEEAATRLGGGVKVDIGGDYLMTDRIRL